LCCGLLLLREGCESGPSLPGVVAGLASRQSPPSARRVIPGTSGRQLDCRTISGASSSGTWRYPFQSERGSGEMIVRKVPKSQGFVAGAQLDTRRAGNTGNHRKPKEFRIQVGRGDPGFLVSTWFRAISLWNGASGPRQGPETAGLHLLLLALRSHPSRGKLAVHSLSRGKLALRCQFLEKAGTPLHLFFEAMSNPRRASRRRSICPLFRSAAE
jgi:hypothetical protein